jgi:glycerol uptake facilitator-like aquaporin
VGTFVLVFTSTAVAVAATLGRATPGGAYDSLAIALAFGVALLIVAAALGHISGAHVNPVVTFGLAVGKQFPWRYVPMYMGAQLVGACLAALATWVAFGQQARSKAHLAATIPWPG